MSAHTKVRKVFPLVDGAHCEVTIQIHNLNPKEADGIVERTIKAATDACQDVTTLLHQRDKSEAQERADRVAELVALVNPDNKVIVHGTAERHNTPQQAVEVQPTHAKVSKAKKEA